MPQQLPTVEPNSVLTFQDLILEVAYKIGCSSYGSDGTGAPAVPTDTHDLVLCQRIVNKAIRMFIHDAPGPNGWKWLRPIAQVDLWPQIACDTSPTPANFVQAAYNAGNDTTVLTLFTPGIPTPTPVPVIGTPAFYQSMELRQIYLNGNPPPGTPGFSPFGLPQAMQVVSLTRSGTTATLTTFQGLGVNAGSPITVYGATQPEYNGVFTVTGNPSPNVITYTVAGSPATPATGAISVLNGAYPIGDPYTILNYLGPTQITIDGPLKAGYPTNIPYSFAAMGDYTLPADFGGQYTGSISFIANTNRGMTLSWVDEAAIRERRQNYNIESGTPYWAAVRLMPTPSFNPLTNVSGLLQTNRRRWELMTWRISSDFLSVIFPYMLHFQDLVNLTDTPPCPFGHDESILAACRAIAEKEVEDAMGPDWDYYHKICLPNSYRVDAMSAPKKIGYFGNPSAADSKTPPIRSFRDEWYQRPTVPVYGLS